MTELSEDEELLLAQAVNSIDRQEAISLGIYAKWSPDELEQKIDELEELQDFFDDIILLNEEADGDSVEELRKRRSQCTSIISILQQYHGHIDDSMFH